MISTMAQVYAFNGDSENVDGMAQLITKPDPVTGLPPVSFATGISLLVFFVFAMLCVSTLAVIKRETGSWKWPIFTTVYMFAVAWVASFAAFQIAS